MKIETYTVRLTYLASDGSTTSTHNVEVPGRPARCSIDDLGAMAGKHIQEMLDMHSLRKEREALSSALGGAQALLEDRSRPTQAPARKPRKPAAKAITKNG